MKRTGYLIDLDGTMYRGTQIIEGAKIWIDWLLEHDVPFLFLTNNSGRTPVQAAQHMLNIGYQGIEPRHFYTSAMAASDTMIRRFPEKKRALMIGADGLQEALENNGYQLVDHDADLVFVGLDKQGNWQKYSQALREVLKGAILVGTNNDRILLSEEGANCGNGSVVALMEYASSREAVKIGKPYEAIVTGALRQLGMSREEVVIVGDNMETDILCGVNTGIKTILVTTGVHTRQQAMAYPFAADHIIEDLRELIDEGGEAYRAFRMDPAGRTDSLRLP